MNLQRIPNMTSSAPPPMDISLRSRNILETRTSSVYPIPGDSGLRTLASSQEWFLSLKTLDMDHLLIVVLYLSSIDGEFCKKSA